MWSEGNIHRLDFKNLFWKDHQCCSSLWNTLCVICHFAFTENKLLSIFCVPVPKTSPNNHTFNALLSLECLYKFSQNHSSPAVMSYSFITKNQVINFSFIYIIKIFLRDMKILWDNYSSDEDNKNENNLNITNIPCN